MAERGWAAFGIFYAAAALVPIALLRADSSYGLVAVLWLFAVVWATDIAAFYAGRAFGGALLRASLSPKKTWSGAIVGTLAGGVAGAGLIAAAPLVGIAAPGLRPIHAGIALAVSMAAQAGDLFESGVKRKFGVKDASQLIPGHGGFMDRLDGFVTGALLALLIGLARMGAGAPATGLLAW
jgi:phosphatidate cytidylyltransferase